MATTSDFKDLNFKLAVIQVLMYEKELLHPKFDLNSFVEGYSERNINTEKEGYEIIPEVKKYFEELEIPAELLSEVDYIYQDGGNEIYLQIIPFWSGEDDVFNITSSDDLVFLPNLKKITLFFDDAQKMVAEFKAKGIEAQYL
jgi:hypothetical protein